MARREESFMFTVGIDPHSRKHVAAAVDELGRVIGSSEFVASDHDGMAAWVAGLAEPRQVAIEGARGYGWALTRTLLRAGEKVIDVPAQLTADGRRTSGMRGKDDESDAVIVARIAMRGLGVRRVLEEHLEIDLKLLVDARDQLVAEACRVRNRLHALLLVLAPGYRDQTFQLTTAKALATAQRLAVRARALDAVRARLAIAAIRRLRTIAREVDELEIDIELALAQRGAEHLRAIRGVGLIVAAKLLGEVQNIDRFATEAAFAAHAGVAPIPASSGNTKRHRLNRGGNRQLNRALFTVARTQARWHPPAKAYLARKRAEGKSAAEARRCLMRHLATAVWKAMQADAHPLPENTREQVA
jgi:transposase